MRTVICFLTVGILFTLVVGTFLGASQEEPSPVVVAILAPENGLSTAETSVQVRGTARTEEPASISLVILDVNGIAQKADLKPDGTFEATVTLARGRNLISAIAIDTNNAIGSDRVLVTSVPKILFFDDFTERARPEWTFKIVGERGRWEAYRGWFTVRDVPEWLPTQAFVGEPWWKNYMIDLDVRFENPHPNNVVAIFLRIQDEHNMLGFFLQPGGQSGFRFQRNGMWDDFVASADTPRFNNAHLRLIVQDHTYTALLNDQTLVTYEDKRRTFSSGYIGLQMAVYPGFWVYFDNVQVKSLDVSAVASLPQPQPTQAPELVERVSKLEDQVSQLKAKSLALQGQLENLAQRLRDVDLLRLQEAIEALSKRLGEVDVVSLSHSVEALAARVEELEKQASLSAAAATPALLEELSQRVETVEGLVGGVDVRGLSGELDSLKAQVGDLSENQRGLRQEVEALKQSQSGTPPEPARWEEMQGRLSALDRQLEKARREAEAAQSAARLGIVLGAAGAALALLSVLGVLRGG